MEIDSPQSITVWFEQLRRGDPNAAAKLWHRFFDRLVTYSRAKMETMNRRVSDEEDIAAGVMTALCVCADRGKLPVIENRESLWRLLLTWTRHDIADQARANRSLKRGGGHVRGDSVFGNVTGLECVVDRVSPPEILMQMQEQCEKLLARLPDDILRTIAVRRMEGHSSCEISEELVITQRTVQRKLDMIRGYWSEDHAD